MNVSKVLLYLIENYGNRIGVSKENFAGQIHRRKNVDYDQACKWLTADSKGIQTENRKKLAEFFRPALDKIEAEWFHNTTVDDVKALIEKHCNHDIWIRLPVTQPVHHEGDIEEMQRLMEGYWTMYRFAFEGSGRVSKELVHIWRAGIDTSFRSYYRVTRDCEQGVLWYAEGSLIAMPRMYGFFGVQTSPGSDVPRARVMFLRKEAENVRKNRHRFGLLMGVDPDEMEPSAGRTLLVRVDKTDPSMSDEAFAAAHAALLEVPDFVRSLGANGNNALRIISNRISRPGQVFTLRTRTSTFSELMREPISELLNPDGADELDGDV